MAWSWLGLRRAVMVASETLEVCGFYFLVKTAAVGHTAARRQTMDSSVCVVSQIIMSRILVIVLLVLSGLNVWAAEPGRGAKADAAAQGWGWLPVPPGQRVPLGDLPLNMATSPDGRWIVITHGGPGQQSLWLFDGTTGKAFPIAVAGAEDAFFHGVAFSSDGKRVYSTGGAANTLYVHDLKDWWQESRIARFSFGPPGAPFFPAGLAPLPDGRTLCVANLLADQLALVDVGNPADPKLLSTIRVGSRPFTVLVDKNGRFAYVTHWGEPTVGIVDLKAKQLVESVKVGKQPVALALAPDAKLLYVACGEDDHIAVVDLQTRKRQAVIELLSSTAGAQPSRLQAMTLSRDGSRLYVASALYHDLLVIDTKVRKVVGMIPTGWCPTAVALAPNADKLYVLSARDLSVQPGESQYAKRLNRGLLQILPVPGDSELELQSRRVCEAHDYDQRTGRRASTLAIAPVPVPRRLGQPSAINHVVMIVQDRQSFDRVFGDCAAAADPWLCYFGQGVTANLHALAENFALCDNFYVDGPVLAGDEVWFYGGAGAPQPKQVRWPSEKPVKPGYSSKSPSQSTSNITQRFWTSLTHSSSGKSTPPSSTYPGGAYGNPRPRLTDDGATPLMWPTTATLWDAANHATMGRRAYGDFANAELYKGTSFTNWVGGISAGNDLKRGDLFVRDMTRIEKLGTWPRLTVVSLPNNQTVGTALNNGSPRAMACENDLAIGRIVSALSRSKFWEELVIFVVPDQPAPGFDHLDAHRSPALVISPYARRGAVVSRFYDSACLMRTIKQILGLAPAGLYELAAVPMWEAFTPLPAPRIFKVIPAAYDIGEKNPPRAYGQADSSGLGHGQLKPERSAALNNLLWTYLHGPGIAPPVPISHRRDVMAP